MLVKAHLGIPKQAPWLIRSVEELAHRVIDNIGHVGRVDDLDYILRLRLTLKRCEDLLQDLWGELVVLGNCTQKLDGLQ